MLAVAGSAAANPGPNADYLYVWARDADSKDSDFLAVVDIAKAEVVATAPVGATGTYAHHTEHELHDSSFLFANGFGAGRTWIFDLRQPLKPQVKASFGDAGKLMHAHSFARLPNGNVLTTYQMADHDNATTGGLAEITPDGAVVRAASAAVPGTFIRPYSLTVVPALDRAVSTTSDMHAKEVATTIQVWRLSDLTLMHTIALPPGPRGKEHHDPAEPRLLNDGRTVMVNTFNCGLYRLDGLDGPSPSARFIHDFGSGDCALAVIAGRYWVQTDTGLPGMVSLDLSYPASPRIAGRLKLADGEEPHWISLAPDGKRIVISSGNKALESRLLLARIDPETGALSLDRSFAMDFDRNTWPHGQTGKAIPHGAVFGR